MPELDSDLEDLLSIHCAYDTLRGFISSCPSRHERAFLKRQLELLYDQAYKITRMKESLALFAESKATGSPSPTSESVSDAATPGGSDDGESGDAYNAQERNLP